MRHRYLLTLFSVGVIAGSVPAWGQTVTVLPNQIPNGVTDPATFKQRIDIAFGGGGAGLSRSFTITLPPEVSVVSGSVTATSDNAALVAFYAGSPSSKLAFGLTGVTATRTVTVEFDVRTPANFTGIPDRSAQDVQYTIDFALSGTSQQKPTVILIKTVKGDSLGVAAQGRNTSHQKKHFSVEERRDCATRWGIPLTQEEIDRAEFYRPADDSEEMRYLQQKRQELHGFLPRRTVKCPTLQVPELSIFQEFLAGTGEHEASTTIAFVRMLSRLLKDRGIGRYIVPVVPDEADSFPGERFPWPGLR